MSHERSDIAGAEGLHSLEGNMCGTAMRGAVALPGSKATSRAKGSHRNLGGLASGHRCGVGTEYDGPHREGEEPKPMMHGHEKSDSVIVAVKPANKAAPCCGAIRGGVSRSGVGGAKDGDQGECGPAKHVPDAVSGKRVTGAGTHTESRKGKEAGEVHRTAAPFKHRIATGKLLRSTEKSSARSGWSVVETVWGGAG